MPNAFTPDEFFLLARVQATLDRIFALVANPTTVQILREIESGPYIRDRGTSAWTSQRAGFGRWLSKHKHLLGIEVAVPGKHIKDDDGHWTTTSSWICLPG